MDRSNPNDVRPFQQCASANPAWAPDITWTGAVAAPVPASGLPARAVPSASTVSCGPKDGLRPRYAVPLQHAFRCAPFFVMSARAATDPIEVARLIVTTLNLDLRPEAIAPDAPLFGEGLGLDSIDALELTLAISREYGLELRSDEARNRQVFASLASLTAYIDETRTR
jgi:acyl carrier protein